MYILQYLFIYLLIWTGSGCKEFLYLKKEIGFYHVNSKKDTEGLKHSSSMIRFYFIL